MLSGTSGTCEKKLAGSQKPCGTPSTWSVMYLNKKNEHVIKYVCDLHVTSVLNTTRPNEVVWIGEQNSN